MSIHFTFIHGISNKPPHDELLRQWLNALKVETGDGSELDLREEHVTASMIYWADVFHESPQAPDRAEESMSENMRSIVAHDLVNDELLNQDWFDTLDENELTLLNALMKDFEEGIEENVETNPDYEELEGDENAEINYDNRGIERIPLPWFIKKKMMKQFLVEVHHYLFNDVSEPRPGDSYRVKDEIRSRFINHVNSIQADKHYLISHSMGTVISYDCLRNVDECPSFDGFMTVGSPLGLDEVQDKIKPAAGGVDYPSKILGDWINVYDKLDVVSMLDKNISNDYKKDGVEVVQDITVKNSGAWRHSSEKYFKRKLLREALFQFIGD